MKWEKREPNGSKATVEGIGLIEIYRAPNGMAVDINGKRAWSCWRDNEEVIQLRLSQDIRQWQYINSFRA